MVPLLFVGGTRSLFFLKEVFGIYMSGFGPYRMLFDVSLVRFVVSLLSQLKHIFRVGVRVERTGT